MRKFDWALAAMMAIAIPGLLVFCAFVAAYVKLMIVILSAIIGAI